MKNRSPFTLIVLVITALLLTACGAAAAPTEPSLSENQAFDEPVAEEPAAEEPMEEAFEGELAYASEADAAEQAPLDDNSVVRTDAETIIGTVPGADRKIIKNAEVLLMVAETENAIDRLTQIIADNGGYIVSSREWFQDWYGENFKHATVTFSVPVNQFENALRRLRGIAVEVLDEQASGQDVTQEFVDLESRLRNLEATSARIREFLDQAKTVQEALQVNAELTAIEQEIEEIKGRMNFLEGRSAYSTITVTLQPELPDFVPTATLTPTATPTPTPTPTGTPWSAAPVFDRASTKLVTSYRIIFEMAIWLGVAVLPILAPILFVGWVIWRISNRQLRQNSPEAE